MTQKIESPLSTARFRIYISSHGASVLYDEQRLALKGVDDVKDLIAELTRTLRGIGYEVKL